MVRRIVLPPPPAARTRGGKKKRAKPAIKRVVLIRPIHEPNGNGEGRRAQDLSVQERRLAAWDLRLEGYSVPEIAKTLELSEPRVYQLIQEYHADIKKYTEEAKDKWREMELARLDKLYVSHWKYRDITKNAQILLSIAERRHKLLGLETTNKHVTVDTPNAVVALSSLDLSRLSNQELEWLEIIITKAGPQPQELAAPIEGQFVALPAPAQVNP